MCNNKDFSCNKLKIKIFYYICVIFSFPVQRNFDPALHPFEVAREYTRALNAVKLERVMAKPFVCSLDGHGDGIQCMTKHPSSLSLMFSGAYDGEVSDIHIFNHVSC